MFPDIGNFEVNTIEASAPTFKQYSFMTESDWQPYFFVVPGDKHACQMRAGFSTTQNKVLLVSAVVLTSLSFCDLIRYADEGVCLEEGDWDAA